MRLRRPPLLAATVFPGAVFLLPPPGRSTSQLDSCALPIDASRPRLNRGAEPMERRGVWFTGREESCNASIPLGPPNPVNLKSGDSNTSATARVLCSRRSASPRERSSSGIWDRPVRAPGKSGLERGTLGFLFKQWGPPRPPQGSQQANRTNGSTEELRELFNGGICLGESPRFRHTHTSIADQKNGPSPGIAHCATR